MAYFRFCFFCSAVRSIGIVALFLFLFGCSSSLKKQSLLSVDDQQMVIEPVADTTEPVDYSVRTEEKIARYQRMLRQARDYGNDSNFQAADSLCRLVFQALTDGSGEFDSSTAADELIETIITLYADLLSDTVSAPEELASQVFHLQLVGSLDSLKVTAEDSAYVAGVFNRSQKADFDVPMVWNSRVQRALFYYLTRNKSTVRRWRERSVTYLPFMKKMFVDSGLPADLAYLPLIESGFNPKAYSRSHASGIWQFIRSTGRRYGLRNNYWIDERRDPVLATKAAIGYLKKLYGDFGHWHLALAAYNCGENGLARSIKKYGTSDYWQLRLPAETMNYVPLYIASVAIAKSPDFDEVFTDAVDSLPFDTVTVNDCIDLRDIAEGTGIDYDSLRRINPQLLHWCTPPDMTGIQLYLPAGTASAFNSFYAALPDEKKVKWYRYRIRPGDNLGSIARHFGIPVQGIKSVNRMRGTRIIAGKYLFIPIPVGIKGYAVPEERRPERKERAATVAEVPEGAKLTVYEVKPGDTVWRLAELFGVSSRQICGWNNLVRARIKVGQVLSIYTIDGEKVSTGAETTQVAKTGTDELPAGRYVVRRGDNPYRIVQLYDMSLSELCAFNNLDARNPVIHPGDTLVVRTSAAATATSLSALTRQNTAEDALTYVVTEGDNLFRIAQNFSISVEQLRRYNHLSHRAVIRPGDTLFIPGSSASAAATSRHSRRTSGSALAEEVVYYMVKSGDNLWRIASDFGISVERLYECNGLGKHSVIMPGDTLRVISREDL